jgi:hypothetical protein
MLAKNQLQQVSENILTTQFIKSTAKKTRPRALRTKGPWFISIRNVDNETRANKTITMPPGLSHQL